MRTLLELAGLKKTHGRSVILDGVDLTVAEGQKIALIGRNGAGKSTLIRILLGEEEADAGEVRAFPTLRLGAVSQHETIPEGVTGFAYLEKKTGREPWACAKMGAQFGLHRAHLEAPASTLSGGYQMRLKLTAMLLMDPNLLVLDEPVNYLDLPTLLLLERFLKTYRGAFIVTSHDRAFLNAVADRTAEIERGKLTSSPEKVDTYLLRKAEARAFVLRTNKKIQKEREHIQEFVDRFRYKASKAKQVQSRIKKLSKMANVDVESLLPTARIAIPSPLVTHGPALHVQDLEIGYGQRVIASDIAFDLQRGEHVALLGGNGMGKSTLLKTLSGVLPPISGTAKWWHKAEIGYYAQHTEAALKPEDTVMEHLAHSAPPSTRQEDLLKMAGDFLFREDDLEKRVQVLSGGERARLCLAGLLLSPHNVLLLDEPTNHLDAETSESLAKALQEYPGTIVFVSHSQSFIKALATRIFEAREGKVRQYPGTYDEYLADLGAAMEEDVHGAENESEPSTAAEAEARRHAQTILKEKRRRQQKIEERMKVLDREKSEILAYYFENPTEYAPEKYARLKELDEELARLEKEWYALLGDAGA
ncbi:MAG: ABC-F family ATP-binding cassette domain-containing protein [Patescibacteria group bacterium]|nr:MAG: ABC-F family ATP-binding cassette domain-containing protein [Patescibacteria group bacterium]